MTTTARTAQLRAWLRAPVESTPSVATVVATQLLALVGLGIATYLTVVHFQGVQDLSCNTSAFNCIKVTTSGESRFFGLPVSVLGLAQYTVMTGLCTPWAWRFTHRIVHVARLALAVVAMAMVLWLIFAEFLIIGAFCEWCTGVHVVTFLLLILVLRSVPQMLGWTSDEP